MKREENNLKHDKVNRKHNQREVGFYETKDE